MTIGTYILVSLIKIVVAVFVLLTGVAYTTLAERKVVALAQRRVAAFRGASAPWSGERQAA